MIPYAINEATKDVVCGVKKRSRRAEGDATDTGANSDADGADTGAGGGANAGRSHSPQESIPRLQYDQ